MVRRVEPDAVTIWLALRHEASVTARAWAGIQQAGTTPGTVQSSADHLLEVTTQTRRIAERLHVAVATMTPVERTVDDGDEVVTLPLTPGELFSYDVAITPTGGTVTGLADQGLLEDEAAGDRLDDVDEAAPLHLALGYAEGQLPTFTTPPATLDGLHIAHASCRKLHGPQDDAMSWLDEHVEAHLSDASARPHQLVLTGDQIYADDVAAPLAMMLGRLAFDLLDGNEHLEVADGEGVEATLHHFPPLRRQRLVRDLCGFTSSSASSHLLTFGEFAAMYLAAWSTRVWRPLGVNGNILSSIGPDIPASVRTHLSDHEGCADISDRTWPASWEDGVDKSRVRVEHLRGQVARTARVLANCATYMIFDDHEVTDDWYLNASWMNRVRAKPLGRNVIRNGVLAYTVFQDLGNDPARYAEGDDGNAKNRALLAQAQAVVSGPGGAAADAFDAEAVDRLVGFGPDQSEQATFHYTVPGPRHLLVVLDTRTRRTLPGQSIAPPKLLGSSLSKQVPKGPFPDERELLVLVSPVPVLAPELIDTIGAGIARMVHDAMLGTKAAREDDDDPCDPTGTEWGAEKYEAESWSLDEDGMEALLGRLAPYSRVVILSGDVHYATSLALDYWRKGQADPDRIVQCTSSPASNRFKEIVEAINRDSAIPQAFLRGLRAERLAWKDGAKVTVPDGQPIAPARRARMKATPSLLPAATWPAGTTVDEDPDWRWRLRQLRDERPAAERPGEDPLPLSSPFDDGDPVASYRAVAQRHQQAAAVHLDHTRTVVFAPNVGLVDVTGADDTLALSHTLLVRHPDLPEGMAATRHVTALAGPSDDDPPELVVEEED